MGLPAAAWALGMALGGTKTEVLLLDAAGDEAWRRRAAWLGRAAAQRDHAA